jgi:ribosome-associated translation inhibitor RaiA
VGAVRGSVVDIRFAGSAESQKSVSNFMQIQINTDHNIEGREALSAHIRSVVERALSHESGHITRVEVHVADENGPKSGPKDMRCKMEARLEHHQPFAVTFDAATVHQAIDGAADKLARLVEQTLGKQGDERKHRTDPPPVGPVVPAQPRATPLPSGQSDASGEPRLIRPTNATSHPR